MKKNRHALINQVTGLVSNIIIWDGREWLPPQGHYIIHDCDGQIGDYWHKESDTFYTINKKRRVRDEQGKISEVPLTDQEKENIEPILHTVYEALYRQHKIQIKQDDNLNQ